MRDSPPDRPRRTVLHAPPEGTFDVRRWPVAAELDDHVAYGWTVTYDLGGHPPHEQVTLPSAVCHLVVEDGEVALHGAQDRRFVRRLAGRGRVVGLRFRPGGASVLVDGPLRALQGTSVDAAGIGLDGSAVVARVEAAADPGAAVAKLATALHHRLTAIAAPGPTPGARPPTDPAIALVREAVRIAEDDGAVTSIAALATGCATTPRTLQRAFARHVGVGPLWVIRQARLHEAAARADAQTDWPRLAAELGYADQAHLVRDWTEVVGVPPARWARGPGAGRPPAGRAGQKDE